MKMNIRIRKSVVMAEVLLLCLSLVGGLLIDNSALAQSPEPEWYEVSDMGTVPLDKGTGYELNPGEIVEGFISPSPDISAHIQDASGKVVKDFGRIGQTSFQYTVETRGMHYLVIYKCHSLGRCHYSLKYRILPPTTPAPTTTPPETQEEVEKSGKLPGGHSARVSIELDKDRGVQGTIVIWHASNIGGAKFYIEDAAGSVIQDFGRVSQRNFIFTPKTAGMFTFVIINPNQVVSSGYNLTYTILPLSPEPVPPYVSMHGQKTDVLVGEEVILTLSAVNPITSAGVLNIQLTLSVPSGWSVTSSGFGHGAGGLWTNSYEIPQGPNPRAIDVQILANQNYDGVVTGYADYYFVGEKGIYHHEDNLPVKARARTTEPTTKSSTPTPTPSPEPSPSPGITPWVIIGAIWAVALGLIIYIAAKD